MLRRELAAAYLGMSPSTLDMEAKAGRLPRPVAITPTLQAWHRASLEAWAADRCADAAGDNAPNPFDT